MKPVIAKLVTVVPVILVVIIVAYITEEVVEDFYSEMLSDFVYPVAAIVILAVLWLKVMPALLAYLNEDTQKRSGD
jgi:tryptophan-rich sensory protein